MVRFDSSPAHLARIALTVALVALTTATASPTENFASTLASAQKAYDRQEYHAAALLYEAVVRDNPVNPDYWRSLAAAHYLAGEYRESIPAYEMALQLRQDQPSAIAYFLFLIIILITAIEFGIGRRLVHYRS